MKTFIFIVALLATYSIAIAGDTGSSSSTNTTTTSTNTTTTPSSPEKHTSKKRNPKESEEKSTCSMENTSKTRTVPEGVLNLIKFFSKQNTKTVHNNNINPPPPSVTLTNSTYGTLFTYQSSSGGETIIHKPAPIVVKRPPTNLVIKHPPIVVKPAPVIFHKPPPIMHRQFFYKPLPPNFNLNNCNCNTYPIKQINSKSIQYYH